MVPLRTKVMVYRVLRILVLVYLLLLVIGHYLINDYVMAGILSLGLIVYTFHNIKSFSDSHSRVLINQLIGLIFITYQSYKDYSRYTDDKILFSYSKPFNDHRQQLGVPIIPTSWRVAFKSSYSIEWDEKKDGVGHERKYIFMNADHTIEFESDDYKLSRTRADSERYVYVRYIYATGKHPDTLSFSYSNGDSAKSITKSIADSILNADHIQKDY